MTVQIARQPTTVVTPEVKAGLQEKAGNVFSKSANLLSALKSYFGPWNMEVLNPEYRSKFSREDYAAIDAIKNGIGPF